MLSYQDWRRSCPPPPLWIPAFAGMTNGGAGMTSARGFQRTPAHRGVKSRSCGLVQLIGTVDSATPHPDPSGGQAPALHFLIPPSAIGLQFGTFRRWRAGIEVDWRAHPVSGYGTCFRTKTGGGLASPPPLWIPAFAGMTIGGPA